MNRQQYHLTVKAPAHLEMDLPVKATILLNLFPDKTKVKEILRSHGFVLTDLSSDQVHVEGSFFKLKAAKASLELLLNSKTKTENAPYQEVTSGAISKYYTKNSSDLNQSRLGSRNKPLHTSPSSPTTSSPWSFDSPNNHPASPEYRASFSPIPNQSGSFRRGRDSFVVDADVFIYADQLRKKEICTILESHNVRMESRQVGDSYNITLLGKSTRLAASKLQSLLDFLNKSLRTQDVPLKDMNREGKALLEKIRKNKNIYNSVLVCVMNDTLHLIGPSDESYQLRQKLLGRPVGQSVRTGRTSDKNSRARSSALPPASRKNTERDRWAVAYPSPVKTTGYSAPKYQDDKQDGVEPEWGAAGYAEGGALRRRSQSESREKTREERANGNMQESENKRPPPKSSMKGLSKLRMFNKTDVMKKLQFWK